jgi:hypothetical protein
MVEDESLYEPKKTNKLKINVEVDSKQMKEALERQSQLEQELEAERTEKEDLQNKLRIVAEKALAKKRDYYRGLGYTGSLETIEDVRNAKEWEGGLDPVGRGGSGSLPLTPAQMGQSSEGYDSYEDMIFDLSERAKKGDKLAIEQKRAIEEKFMNAIRSGDLPTIIYDENKPEFKGQPSILKKVLERQNERVRERFRERKEN